MPSVNNVEKLIIRVGDDQETQEVPLNETVDQKGQKVKGHYHYKTINHSKSSGRLRAAS